MGKPARRKHIDRVRDQLYDIAGLETMTRQDLGRMMDTLSDHGVTLARLGRWVELPASDVERIVGLLDGVRVALERLGGNGLPSFRNDVLALRDQMGEFRRELNDYRCSLMRLTRWLDAVFPGTAGDLPGAGSGPGRKFNHRKKGAGRPKTS